MRESRQRREVLIKMLYFQCLRAFHPCFYTGETFTVQKTSSRAGSDNFVVYFQLFLPVKGAVTILLHLKNHSGEKESGRKTDKHRRRT